MVHRRRWWMERVIEDVKINACNVRRQSWGSSSIVDLWRKVRLYAKALTEATTADSQVCDF